jgi:hypothetical protein
MAKDFKVGRGWRATATARRFDLAPWPTTRSAREVQLTEALRQVDPDVLIDSLSTGVSFWDGLVPDPLDPAEG